MPLALSDNQLRAVMVATRDLPAAKRCALLEAVATELRHRLHFTDAELAAALRAALAAVREAAAQVGASSARVPHAAI
jgi:hypothetical protein